MLRAKDAVARHEQWGNPGFPLLPITTYVSTLTTEEARALAEALDAAGLKRDRDASGVAYGFEVPGSSVDPPLPDKGPVRNVVGIAIWTTLPHGETVCSACG
jgi:hypothetical protein